MSPLPALLETTRECRSEGRAVEPLSWIRVGVPEEDATEAFELIEQVLYDTGILFDMEHEL